MEYGFSTACTFARVNALPPPSHPPPANPRLLPTYLPAYVAQTLREYIVPLYLAACLCDASLRERYGAAIDALSLSELSRLLDADTLRCECEDQVADFICGFIKTRQAAASDASDPSQPPTPLTPAEQRRLWAVCRFKFLSSSKLHIVACAPHVPHDALAYALMLLQDGTDPASFGVAYGHRFNPRYTYEDKVIDASPGMVPVLS